MLKRKRKLTAMLLALAVLLGGLQQFTMPGVKAQAAARQMLQQSLRQQPMLRAIVLKVKMQLRKILELKVS